MTKESIKFIAKTTLLYAFTYLFVGAIAYQLLTKQFYVGDNSLFTMFLRSESNQSQWTHVVQWQFPMLFLRSLLIALVLLPFVKVLETFSFKKRVLVIFALLFVLTHLAAAAPSPGNIEGFIYMRPELMNLRTFLLVQPEMIAQTLLFALGAAYILGKRPKLARMNMSGSHSPSS